LTEPTSDAANEITAQRDRQSVGSLRDELALVEREQYHDPRHHLIASVNNTNTTNTTIAIKNRL
jgi:hypothetical protein